MTEKGDITDIAKNRVSENEKLGKYSEVREKINEVKNFKTWKNEVSRQDTPVKSEDLQVEKGLQ